MKKTITLIAAVLMLLSACSSPDPIVKDTTKEPVTDNPEKTDTLSNQSGGWKSFSGGEGTEASPYIIATASDIRELAVCTNNNEDADKYASANYLQTADIDMTDTDFFPICQGDIKFSGNYNGDSHTISNLVIDSDVNKASGFVAYLDGGIIKNLNFTDIDVDAVYVYCGSIVGYMENSATVSGCMVSGDVNQYVSGLKINSDNEGYSGGLVGYMASSTLEDCTMDGNVSIYGKYSGGIVGYADNSTIKGCKFLKGNAVNIYQHWNGGIVGLATGAKTLISDCSFEGNISSAGCYQGGIVGQLEGGTVEKCAFGSYATLGCNQQYCGGIVGAIIPFNEVLIDKCAAYGTIKASYGVAGIAGYCGNNNTSANAAVTIRGCAAESCEITSTKYNSWVYSLAAGIVGWSAGTNAITIKGCYGNPSFIQCPYTGSTGAMAGIIGYQNSTGGATIDNCYSTVTPANMLLAGEKVTMVVGTCYYGGIYCRATQTSTISNCYCDSSMPLGTGSTKATEIDCETLSTAQLSDGTLLSKLQASADGVTWIAGDNGLPTIQDLPADPNVKPKSQKRVSIIGDSISTFSGWIPSGYWSHYPTSDGALTLVSDVYWYKLIYDYMQNATFDMNISYAATRVAATKEKPNLAFTERFVTCNGCGNPDIIIIHGGTNDYYGNVPLLPDGIKLRQAEVPSDDALAPIFSVADAASTRGEINALPDSTFCEAYVKLMCQISERYPKCKVVCLIGDYLNAPIEQSTIKIADHYGAKVVDLFAVNGFNDQVYMPKHDYTGTDGCHPGKEAMAFIANKIYTELGTWLEQ